MLWVGTIPVIVVAGVAIGAGKAAAEVAAVVVGMANDATVRWRTSTSTALMFSMSVMSA